MFGANRGGKFAPEVRLSSIWDISPQALIPNQKYI